MLKFVRNFLVIFIIFIAIIYLSSGYIFDAAAKKILPSVLTHLADRGIEIVDYDFEGIRFTSLSTISARKTRANVKLKRGVTDDELKADFFAEKINIHLKDVLHPAVNLSSNNFQFKVEKATEIPGTKFGRFDRGHVKFHDPISLANPRDGLLRILEDISGFFREEDISPNIDLRAIVTFSVNGRESQAFLYTTAGKNGPVLRFAEDDIRRMADTFQLELSDDEVNIIADYPLRAPTIIRITSDAKESSQNAHRRNRAVPEDAYRHVLWSYLLTQKFGKEFAEMVTDAHEVLPTNTAAERRMDFHNNQIGRQYALRGETRNRILWLVNNDPRVIKKPEDA